MAPCSAAGVAWILHGWKSEGEYSGRIKAAISLSAEVLVPPSFTAFLKTAHYFMPCPTWNVKVEVTQYGRHWQLPSQSQ